MLPTFEDCVVEINEKHGKGYPMTLSGPTARQTGTLRLSPASANLRGCLARLKSFATDEAFLHEFGGALYNALFPSRMLAAWNKNRHGLDGDTHLRLKLMIHPPELAALPWELMCNEDGIPVTTSTPIVRYMPCPDPPKPLNVRPPLRILVSIANPRDQAPLSSSKEAERIKTALAPLVERGLVHLTISEQASGIGLLDDLRRGVHIWHFIGHGLFNVASANGSLAFENESGDTDLIDSKRLRILLEQSSVRLAVLNACETGRFSLDPLLGIAPALVRSGVPAVVAMQFAFPDTSAVEFSSMFYRALADGFPVDACVSEGRKAVITRLGLSQPDWAIPVLYMRSADGRLFEPIDTQDAATRTATETMGARLPDATDFHRLDTGALRQLVALWQPAPGVAGAGLPTRGRAAAADLRAGDERRLLLAARRELASRQGCGAEREP